MSNGGTDITIRTLESMIVKHGKLGICFAQETLKLGDSCSKTTPVPIITRVVKKLIYKGGEDRTVEPEPVAGTSP